jgi:uncharacterized protein (DUF1778 family)
VANAKSDRLEARITPEQAEMIRRAVELEGTTKTEFTVQATLARAREVLADQRVFVLAPGAWEEISAVLDAPATFRPKLSKLLAQPSVFDR